MKRNATPSSFPNEIPDDGPGPSSATWSSASVTPTTAGAAAMQAMPAAQATQGGPGPSTWAQVPELPRSAYDSPRPHPNPVPFVRVGLVVMTMVAVAVGLGMTLVSLNTIITIWFEYQWVPVARLAMGLVVVGVALVALRLVLTSKRLAK